MLKIDISSFIKQHQLPARYQQLSQQWFSVLAEKLSAHRTGAEKPIVVGINGAQGSGKSTLAALLCHLLEKHFKLKTVSLSLDDFYLTRQERDNLAKKVHPLLNTRGVPGTHDVALAYTTIQKLQSHHLPVTIPRFDKAIDDRVAIPNQADNITESVDVILFEGWCLGAEAEGAQSLVEPINELEATEDTNQVWRQYVNLQLANHYQKLFGLVDIWVMLKAPSFDTIFNWRLEQENKLREKVKGQGRLMDDTQIARFIQFYQRTTENTLKTLPDKVHYLYELDCHRQVVKMTTKAYATRPLIEKNWLVFTDMDGSLLDHNTYAFDDASPTLEELEQHHIPVIPITSKTQAELEFLRKLLHNNHPFIIENGAAIFIPKSYFNQQPKDTISFDGYWIKAFVKTRQHWQNLIASIAANYDGQFTTFFEAGINGIMEMTGLDKEAATRAAQRQYGEPIAWLGSQQNKQAFISELRKLGANILEGGRFIHVSGKSDKGLALKWLTQVYQAESTEKNTTTIALGDSQNDKAMLEVADYAVVIRSPTHPPPKITREKQLFTSVNTGPKGWVEGIEQFIRPSLTASPNARN